MEEIINFDSSYKWQCKDTGALGSCFFLCIIYAFKQNHVHLILSFSGALILQCRCFI